MRLIDADALLAHIKNLEAHCENKKYEQAMQDMLDGYFPEIIANQPTIEAKPVRHGRWILTGRTNVYGGKEVECSECGFRVMLSPEHIENITEYERYCCHCGLRMDGGADND